MSINKVILIGNVGQAVDIRHLNDANTIANLSIATSEKWKDKQSGQMKEATEWHRVVMYGRLADIAGEYLTKGSKVYIEGRLKTRKWTDKQGVERYTTEVQATELQMLDNKPANKAPGTQASPAVPQVADHAIDFEDDIPF